MSKPRVGLLTFHNSINYGSVLQAYALVRVLQQMDMDVQVVDFRPPAQVGMYYADNARVTGLRSFAKNAYRRALRGAAEARRSGFSEFREKYLPLTDERFMSTVDTEFVDGRYDIMVCGSDQIWNAGIADFSEVYLLPFSSHVGKIAYAPSLNNGDFAGCAEESRYRKLLMEFDALSVREESGRKKLDRFLAGEKHISVVADPTLLLNKTDYLDICSESRPPYPYVFLYTLNNSRAVVVAAIEASSRLRLPVVTVFANQRTPLLVVASRGRVRLSRHSAPEDFVGLLSGAEFVVTDSFHGTAFSVLLQKPFFVPIGEAGASPFKGDTRIENLLTVTGLSERMHKPLGDVIGEPVDFQSAEARIEEYAERSRRFLRDALSSASGKAKTTVL